MTARSNVLPPEMLTDAFAATYEASGHRITGPISVRALDLVGVRPGQRILDIAAGAGALSGPAAERGASVLATDLAPGMVRRLAERLRPFDRCDVAEMDGQSLDLADAGVDTAFCVFGTIFFADWRAGLREQARVVRRGGAGCVVTWRDPPGGGPFAIMAAALAEVLGRSALPPPPEGMTHLADPDRLAAALADAGFSDVRVDQIEGLWIGRGGASYLADNAALHQYMPGYAGLPTALRHQVDAAIERQITGLTRDGLVTLRSIANVAIGIRK